MTLSITTRRLVAASIFAATGLLTATAQSLGEQSRPGQSANRPQVDKPSATGDASRSGGMADSVSTPGGQAQGQPHGRVYEGASGHRGDGKPARAQQVNPEARSAGEKANDHDASAKSGRAK